MAVKSTRQSQLDSVWARHNAEWRSPAQIASQWEEASVLDPALLDYTINGPWWELLSTTGSTLVVTREYEHLVIAMHAARGKPHVSFMKLPHPSGMAWDANRQRLYVASTRNPNQIIALEPFNEAMPRRDLPAPRVSVRNPNPLLPRLSWYLPGCFYLHDLAMIQGQLHGNSVGQNAIVRFSETGEPDLAWWPKSLDTPGGLRLDRNYLQLNSIAAGADLPHSYFSASCELPSTRRPGHRNFPVDGTGVVFSGKTRSPVMRGLTRPHSARLRDHQLWVNNSGYGQLAVQSGTGFEVAAKLPGWTRGLAFSGHIAFVGTSRVLPRFQHYAPGLDINASVCGLHAVDLKTGRTLASLHWPSGNQIFAIELVPTKATSGLPFSWGKRASEQEKRLFYAYRFSGIKNRKQKNYGK